MSEVIGRVAKAMYSEPWRQPWEEIGPHAQAFWRRYARRAIEAMREPSDAMLDAGWEHTGDPCWKHNVADAWRVMIDEALR